MARGMVNGSWHQRCASSQAGVPALLAVLFRDRLFSGPRIPDLYEVPVDLHSCISDSHIWSVGMLQPRAMRVTKESIEPVHAGLGF